MSTSLSGAYAYELVRGHFSIPSNFTADLAVLKFGAQHISANVTKQLFRLALGSCFIPFLVRSAVCLLRSAFCVLRTAIKVGARARKWRSRARAGAGGWGLGLENPFPVLYFKEMLQNGSLFAIVAVDTVENEPSKVSSFIPTQAI